MKSVETLSALVTELLSAGRECEWIEFKLDNANPEEIAEYISALSNSSRLHGRERGYIVWGVDDESCKLVGTKFKPTTSKKGNEELESWLVRMTNPTLDLRFHVGVVDEKQVVVLEVPAALGCPTSFGSKRFVRVGSYKKSLADHVAKERALWTALSHEPFERGLAATSLRTDEVVELLDVQRYFELADQAHPDTFEKVVDRLIQERLVRRGDDGLFSVTNLGAVLFARKLDAFDGLQRKAVRVVTYLDETRVEARHEQEGIRGYAAAFEGLIDFINNQFPQNEVLGVALRTKVQMYPEVAIRELVANALIHQDLQVSGSGPLIEIFSDRVEVTNPGVPLIDTSRFIDLPPQSRNDQMASFMRRVNICEERGSGIDKVISAVEAAQLPPPDFLVLENHTKAVMFALRPFSQMSAEERIRACYQHACLRQVSFKKMTNESLRGRFGIEAKNYSMASRVIRDTVNAGLVRPANPRSASKRHAAYVPFWG